jgi:hypothetical protein
MKEEENLIPTFSKGEGNQGTALAYKERMIQLQMVDSKMSGVLMLMCKINSLAMYFTPLFSTCRRIRG